MGIKRIRVVLLIIAVICATLLDGKYVSAEELPAEPSQDEPGEETGDDTGEPGEESGASEDTYSPDEEIPEDFGEGGSEPEEDSESEDTVIREEELTEDTGLEELVFGRAGDDAPYGMKINLLSKPYGVTKEKLSFSWMDASVNDMQTQSAYRIVLSKRLEDVGKGNYLHDTQWIQSADNTSVLHDLSSVLEDNELYYWQVQIRNGQGKESSLSEPQAFTTAVGGKWASTSGIWGTPGQKVVMLRHQVQKPSDVEKAVLSITAASTEQTCQYVYNLYVNGKEVGAGPPRQDGGTLYYNTYDISDLLKDGENVIGAVNYAEAGQAFLCQLTYYYLDGRQEIVTNSGRDSAAWKVLNAEGIYIGSDKDSIGTTYYTARKDNVNASQYPEGWQAAGYHEEGWRAPSGSGGLNGMSLKPAQINNMKRYEVAPQSVKALGNGRYLIDFGKEIVGSIRLNANSSGGTITLEYGEELDASGNVKYAMNTGNVYQERWSLKSGSQILSGIGMKTFRYVMISGLSFGLGADNIKGLSLRQEFDEDASGFDSSNKVLNDLYGLVKHTSKVTNQDVYVDTQNRERRPYEGDALITAMTSYSFSEASPSAKLSAEYLLSHTTWPAEYSLYNIMLVYENYMYTGDARDLEVSYQLLKDKSLENYYDASMGLMKNVAGGSVSGQRIMVDWPTSELDGYKLTSAYYNTVFNAVCVGGYGDMAKIAKALGHEDESRHYQNLSDTIKKNLIEKLYNPERGEFYDGLDSRGNVVMHSSQHGAAYALAFGVYTNQAMADKIYASIEDDEEIKMSVYSAYFLLQGLYRSNHGDLARKIMSNPEKLLGVRSWGYMMYGLGATVTTEAWSSALKANMSFCHPWGSSPGSMLVRGMFGIQPTSAGFDTFQVKLQPGGVKTASIKVPTMKGSIEAAYSLDGNGSISGTVTVPSNSEAKLCLPVRNGNRTIMVGGAAQKTETENGYLTCRLKGGTYTFTANNGILPDESEWLKEDAVYSTFANGGWSGEITNGFDSGRATGNRIEAIKIGLRNQRTAGCIEYAVYMQSYGWQDWSGANGTAGMPGAGKRTEAFKVRLTGEMKNAYDVYYRAYVDGIGWMDWAENGEAAGTSGYAKELRMIQVKLVKKGEEAPGSMAIPYKSNEKMLSYRTHVQTYGWQGEKGDGEISGTSGEGKRLEAIQISVKNTGVSGGITYRTHVQSYGWQGWKSDGAMAGTSGEAKRLEAIQIKLTGELEQEYDVYYRVHVQTFGWLGWAKNGVSSGSEGYAKRLEAIQIKLVPKGNSAPGETGDTFRKAALSYRTHVQSYGWQAYVFDGAVSGTSGQAKRLEAIQIQKKDEEISGSVQYRTHVQTYGWEDDWRSDGAVSGTSGQAKRLEAIQIRLTGDMEKKYDIYYRVHAQTYGWLGWAVNGESAGTEGLAKRLEAIEIVLVEKGKSGPEDMGNAFVEAQ